MQLNPRQSHLPEYFLLPGSNTRSPASHTPKPPFLPLPSSYSVLDRARALWEVFSRRYTTTAATISFFSFSHVT